MTTFGSFYSAMSNPASELQPQHNRSHYFFPASKFKDQISPSLLLFTVIYLFLLRFNKPYQFLIIIISKRIQTKPKHKCKQFPALNTSHSLFPLFLFLLIYICICVYLYSTQRSMHNEGSFFYLKLFLQWHFVVLVQVYIRSKFQCVFPQIHDIEHS